MKVKTKILLTLVVGLLSGSLSMVRASVALHTSQPESEKKPCLVVKLQGEGESVFFLGESPKLMYFSDSLAVIYNNQQLNFALKDIKDFHFDERLPSGITQTEAQGEQQGQANFSESLAVFRNFPAGTRITAFTIEGRQVAVVVADKEGYAQLNLGEKPAGIYIINVGKRSFKWLKK